METFVSEPGLRLDGKAVVIPGFAYGLRFTPILVKLTVRSPSDPCWQRPIEQFLDKVLPDLTNQTTLSDHVRPGDPIALIIHLLHRLRQLQRSANIPVHETGRIVEISSSREKVKLAIPFAWPGPQATHAAFQWLLTAANDAINDQGPAPSQQTWPEIQDLLRKATPSGANVPHFMRAAYAMNIPVMPVAGVTLQYGQGSQACWLQSSLTDETPVIATNLARSKAFAGTMLHRCGLPVPRHRQVKTVEIALSAAEDLGYPVVVKPEDLDGGVGVAAGLTTPDEVRDAFLAAQKYSKNLLVEKHVEGRDYRLTVLHGELIWAVERVPGGVIGDGRQTVRALLDQLNADPRRGIGQHAPLKCLEWDDEAEALLRKASLERDSVPAAGQFVRLRRIANTARGGMPVAVTDQVHPDNKHLAERAANALQLDLAGVDLLIPDISRSWRETGAAICEVNAQPQLGEITGAHLYALVLSKLISGDGRIPILTIIGADCQSALVGEIVAALRAGGKTVGAADRDEVLVNGVSIARKHLGTFAAGQALMYDRSIDVAILCLCDGDLMRAGLPFDRYDLLLLASGQLGGVGEQAGSSGPPAVMDLVMAVLPACLSKVIPLTDCGMQIDTGKLSAVTQAHFEKPVARDQAAKVIAAQLMAADERHRKPVSA